MKSKLKTLVVFPLFILLGTLFMAIGYASMNSITGEIKGFATTEPQSGVFITDVSVSSEGVDDPSLSVVDNYFRTMLESTVNLSKINGNSSVTYTVRVYNNTTDAYAFRGTSYDEEFYSNSDIVFDIEGIVEKEKLPGKTGKTFTITFHYKDNVVSDNNILESFINFEFKKLYTVTYNNITIGSNPIDVYEEEDLVAAIDRKNVTVEMGGKRLVSDSDYTFIDGILTVFKVSDDVVITGSDLPDGIPNTKDALVEFYPLGENENSYHLEFSMENTTNATSTGWVVYIKVPDDAVIKSNANCEYELRDGFLILKNVGWNGEIRGTDSITDTDPDANIKNRIADFTIETNDKFQVTEYYSTIIH